MRLRRRGSGRAGDAGTLPSPALGDASFAAAPAAAPPRHTLLLVLAITALGLALRLAGIHWGLPGPEHEHSYHPDEILLDWAARNTNPLWGDFDPGFYNYGSVTIFLLRLAYDLSVGLWPPADAGWLDVRVHLLGRLLSVLFGVATIPLVFDLGRRLAGRAAGLAGALVLAITPAHVANSHYFSVDVPAAFFVTAALCAAMRLVERPRLRWALIAGACAGLAAATKYNAGLVLLAPLAALALSLRRRPLPPGAEGDPAASGAEPATSSASRKGGGERLKLIGLASVCVVATAAFFLLGCPGVILNTAGFLKDFLYEVRHVQEGHGNRFTGTPPGWIYHLTTSLRFGLGLPLLAAALVAVGRVARRPGKGDWVLAAWVIPYYLVIGGAQVKFLRYTVPLLPVLAVWVGVLAAHGLAGVGRSRARALAAALLVGAGFWTLGSAIACTALFATVDPRDRAALAVQTQLPRGATVALLSEPWFYTPPLVPWNGGGKTRGDFEDALHQRGMPYAFLPGGSSLFLNGDLVDAPGMASKLSDSADPVSLALRPRFTANMRSVLRGYSLGAEHWGALQPAFMAELNALLKSGPFESAGLTNLALSDEARAILARRPEERNMVRLNRLILESAYPAEIRSRPVDWTAARLRTDRPDCFIVSSLEIRDDLRLRRPETRDLVAALESDYRKLTFPPVASWPGLFGPGYPPEDWLYPAPTVYVYLRR